VSFDSPVELLEGVVDVDAELVGEWAGRGDEVGETDRCSRICWNSRPAFSPSFMPR